MQNTRPDPRIMEIEIIGTESLGVRGLCCFIKIKKRKILIDPGIALGYLRYGLIPHPFQVAVDEKIQKRIIKRWKQSTDIVISHFHGDHVPLENANPYQLNIEKLKGLNPDVKIWTKSLSNLSSKEIKRADSFSNILNKNLIEAEEKEDGEISFSKALSHGEESDNSIKVIMTRIKEEFVFVHSSDIELLNNEAVSQIREWKPDILFLDGPPLYLSNRVTQDQIDKAWFNAQSICETVNTLILDHHLLRCNKGIEWLDLLSSKTGKNVICGADFMNKPRLLLEANRKNLYKYMPVDEDWHKLYSEGKVNTESFWKKGKKFYKL